MNRILLTIFGIFILQSAFTQSLSISPTVLNFGTQTEEELDSLQLTITNLDLQEATIGIKIPISYYNRKTFWVKDSSFTLSIGGSRQVWVYCRITHNLLNNSEIIVSGPTFDYAIDLRCQGRFTNVYYSSTENIKEDALETALRTKLAQNYNSLGYNGIRDEMYSDYDNHNDSVTCIYTNRKAKFNTRSGATSNNFNCEHTFPQGYFGSANPMVSDGHHLFPTDETANNSRGNLPFGVATPPFVNPTGNAPSLNGGGKYEPQDSHKGNCARAMLYFRVRYQDYQNFFAPQAATLYQWHKQFAPAAKDVIRNVEIFTLQNNRNPFIDYPQLADRLGHLWSIGNIEPGPGIVASRYLVDFGAEATESSAQSQVVLWNPSFQPNTLTSYSFTNNQFEWVGSSPTAETLQKGDSKVLEFRLKAGLNLSSIQDTLTYSFGIPATQAKIVLQGIVTATTHSISGLNWSISPIPTSDFLAISSSNGSPSPTAYHLFDLQGKILISSNLKSIDSSNRIDISSLPNGMYILVLAGSAESKSFRIIKD